MKRWLLYLRIALVAVLGFYVGTLRAQEREPLPDPYRAAPAVPGASVPDPYRAAPVLPGAPGIPYSWAFHGDATAGPQPDWQVLPSPDHRAEKHPGPVCTWLRDHCSCWSHHNCYCCGTFYSEWVYTFGSCKAFFGEPCLKAPPPMLLPPGYPSDGGPGGAAGIAGGAPGMGGPTCASCSAH
jgi:hypothetical protein